MKKRILIIIIIFTYCCLLFFNGGNTYCEIGCKAICADGSSAGFYDYTFEIESVYNDNYNSVVGKTFVLREKNSLLGSVSNVGDKATFKLTIISFRINNHKIFPLCFLFIGEKTQISFIGVSW